MKRLRVLYSFGFRLGRTGIGNTAWQQANALLDAGCQVTVLAGRIDRSIDTRARQTLKIASISLPYRALGVSTALALHDARTASFLKRHAGAFDVVHAWPASSLRTLRTARRLGIAGLLERPNTHTAQAARRVAAEWKALGLAQPAADTHNVSPGRLRRELAEYEAASHLLCPSRTVEESFLDEGFEPERLLSTHYGYDASTFTPPADRNRASPTILFLGRCEPRKGLHWLLRAWSSSRLSGVGKLMIVGRFADGYRAVIDSLIGACPKGSVELHDFTNDPASMLRRADLLAVPSLEEGSPLVCYEALGSGCGLLASRGSGSPVGEGGGAMIHETGDVAMLTRHLDAVCDDRSIIDRLGREALISSARLTWNHCGQSLVRAYERATEASLAEVSR